MTNPPAGTERSQLARMLGTWDLTQIVVGTVIGSGIFIVPAAVLTQSEQFVGPALTVWLVGGVLSLLGALTYGELGAMNPRAGGVYVYVREAFGSAPAFLYGWTMFFAISSGSLATLAVAASGYLQEFVALSPVMQKVAALLMIAVIAFLNVRGTRRSATVQNWTTLIKVAAILVMSVVLISLGDGLAGLSGQVWPPSFSLGQLSAAGLAMIGVLWAYEGWQYVTFSAGEAVDPQRTFPRAIVFGTAGLIVLYMLAVVAYVAALGPADASASGRVAADAVARVVGPGAAKLIAAAIIVSMFSAANGITLTAPRVFFAMARDGLFFRRLAEVHPGFGTPATAVSWSCAWSAVLVLSGTFEQLLTYVVFAGWVFWGLGGVSVFVYRRKQPDAHRPFKVPGYPVTPVLFVLSAVAIVVNTIVAQPVQGLLGLLVVLSGVPAYLVWRKK
ncbi:MAG TPA: amino acid permease [Gemmatimonadales bacterium]|nr:amino acid permease [Gemmatimonadales bacterium]